MGGQKSETASIDDFDEFCYERKQRNTTTDVERYEAPGGLGFFSFLSFLVDEKKYVGFVLMKIIQWRKNLNGIRTINHS